MLDNLKKYWKIAAAVGFMTAAGLFITAFFGEPETGRGFSREAGRKFSFPQKMMIRRQKF